MRRLDVGMRIRILGPFRAVRLGATASHLQVDVLSTQDVAIEGPQSGRVMVARLLMYSSPYTPGLGG